jgi:hypothetical protein
MKEIKDRKGIKNYINLRRMEPGRLEPIGRE